MFEGLLERIYKGAMLVLILTVVFYGGFELGAIKNRMDTHEGMNYHSGAVPRTEIENRLKRIESDISEIKISIQLHTNATK